MIIQKERLELFILGAKTRAVTTERTHQIYVAEGRDDNNNNNNNAPSDAQSLLQGAMAQP